MRRIGRATNARLPQWAGWIRMLAAAALFLAWAPAALAQQDDQLEGINGKEYNVKQSIEFGGRFVDISGNENVYNTFVNLQQGARLLGFTTEMRSLDNHGGLFDRLYVNAFGYGGDPNDVTRIRIAKNTWYNFDALVRRDVNTWDYSLFANPMNPTAGFVNGPPGYGPLATSACTGCIVDTSPHLFDTRRYLSDYNLLLLPQSKVRVRMGYSRNIVSGPGMSTIHLGTDQLLTDQVRTTVNSYRLGVDYRALPRTNISYDQIWTDYKGDTGSIDRNQLFPLSTGTLVDLGVPFNATAGQPCNPTFVTPPPPPNSVVNPACSAVINYLTHRRVRSNSPTEQISLQSNYWKNVDISGRFSYTGASTYDHGYMESLFGRARNNLSNYLTHGNVSGERIAAVSDLGVTWHITNAWSFLDSFHYSNFHNPVELNFNECDFFSANLITAANFFTPISPLQVTCNPPLGVKAGTPNHTTGSNPDLVIDVNSGFLKQDEKMNLVEVDYQHSNRFGARAGFRYWHRTIADKSFVDNLEFFFPNNANRGDCALVGGVLPPGCTAIGGGAFQFMTPAVVVDTGNTEINQYSGLFGFWARPLHNWRISFDTELMSADKVYTRISPRQSQEYRVRSSYKPVDWVNLNGSIRIWEARDNVTGINNLQHDRSYGFSALFQRTEKLAVDITYDYNNVFSQILICYPNAGLTVPSLNPCPGLAPGSGFVQNLSSYENRSHYGGIDLLWRPIPKLTAHLGGNFTGTSGFVLIINPPNQIPGSLNSKWLTPTGGLEYAFTKNWMGRAFWNYYGYHEDPVNSTQDIYAPRNFHSNNVTLSVRYAF